MQKNHIGGIHIAKKVAREYFRGHIQCVSGHLEESNDFDEKCHAGNNPCRNESASGS